MKIRGRQ
jgi:hypothetical protein